jgi:hypothetical protein
MKFLKENIFDIIFLTILSSLIIVLSNFFSIYSSDLHHWGFISSHALDYINGGKLFKEIFVQYGVGQLIFFKFINYFYQINFTSTGIITSVVYSLNLIIIYFIIKRISSTFIAFLILTIILFIHPFIFFPWPDYIAGLCLSLFCLLIIFTNSNKKIFYLLAGLFLFLSIIFRTTYILNIIASIVAYLLVIKINKKFYNKFLINSLLTFVCLFTAYIFYLLLQNDFVNWAYQGIGVIKDYAYGSNSTYMTWIVNNLGENFWILIKLGKIFIRFFIKLIFPNTLENLIIFIFFLVNILFIFSFFNRRLKNFIGLKIDNQNNKYFFIALLGFFGIVQSVFYFNFFKNINSSSAILFTTAIIIKFFFNIKLLKNNRDYYVFSFFILFILSFKFLDTLKTNFKINDSLYSVSSISYFGKRKFIKEDLEYYYEMKKYLCKDEKKIINFTLDTNLVYLCSIKEISYHPYFHFLKNISPNLFERFNNGKLYNNEILITPEGPNYKKLKLYYSIKVPKTCCSWWTYEWPGKSFYLYLNN